jgi:hypothetical protein
MKGLYGLEETRKKEREGEKRRRKGGRELEMMGPAMQQSKTT